MYTFIKDKNGMITKKYIDNGNDNDNYNDNYNNNYNDNDNYNDSDNTIPELNNTTRREDQSSVCMCLAKVLLFMSILGIILCFICLFFKREKQPKVDFGYNFY